MDRDEQDRWARRLRPIRLALVDEGFSVDQQLDIRLKINAVASLLAGGIALFFVLIFGGFGQVRIGLVVAAPIGLFLVWAWWRQLRLGRAVAAYHRASAATAARS